MKFMILVKSNPSLEKKIDEMSAAVLEASMAEMGAFNDELKKTGVIKDCDGLRPSRDGKRVRFDGTSRTVVDGPFEGDLVAGYWIWELYGPTFRPMTLRILSKCRRTNTDCALQSESLVWFTAVEWIHAGYTTDGRDGNQYSIAAASNRCSRASKPFDFLNSRSAEVIGRSHRK